MADRLDRLGHHGVVRGHDQHHQVRDLGSPRPHRRERLVSGGVQEADCPAVVEDDVIRTDVLRDAAGLARDHVGPPDEVQERGLSMVHVPHDRHDGRPRDQLAGVLRFLLQLREIGLVGFLADRREPELVADQLDLVEVQPLIDRDHEAEVLEGGRDDRLGRHVDQVRELRDREELVDPYGRLLPLDLLFALLALHFLL